MAKMNLDLKKFAEKFSSKKIRFYLILCGVLTAVFLFCFIYFGLVRFSLYSSSLRTMITVLLLTWSVPYFVIRYKNRKAADKAKAAPLNEQPKSAETGEKVKGGRTKRIVNFFRPHDRLEIGFFAVFTALITFIIIIIILSVAAWPLFNARNYRNLIDIDIKPTENFYSDVEEYDQIKPILPVVDKAYAKVLGDKQLGIELGLGSQFNIQDYTLIEHEGGLYWIGALEHNTFFTWMSNKAGTPGYVKINAANPSDVSLVRTNKLVYVPSAYFGQDLERQLYFKSMGKVVADRRSFELDDNGVPHYVFSVINKRIALTGGEDTVGILTLNVTDGSVKHYSVENAPSWVNHVYPTEQVNQQLNWWGHYVHGYWNNVFAKKEVMQVSDGYNYIYNKGEFYLYTGMTSTGNDESIVGVVLINLKTKNNVTLYQTGGMTEYAAAEAAKGVFQAEKYYATYPLLLNYHNNATYLIMLKDNAGYVKQYAFVNLLDLSKYGTGSDLDKAEADYQNKISFVTQFRYENAEVTDIQSVVKNNNTVYLIRFKNSDGDPILNLEGDAKTFEASITLTNELAFLKNGDIVSFEYMDKYIQKISFGRK